MSQGLLFSATHTGSRRSVMIVDEKTSVWAYLTAPGTISPVADCWLLNLVDAPMSLEDYRASQDVPPVTRRYVREPTAALMPRTGDFRAHWSADGDAVAVSIEGTVAGYLLASEPHGFSRDLKMAGPFGNLFNAHLAGELFSGK